MVLQMHKIQGFPWYPNNKNIIFGFSTVSIGYLKDNGITKRPIYLILGPKGTKIRLWFCWGIAWVILFLKMVLNFWYC